MERFGFYFSTGFVLIVTAWLLQLMTGASAVMVVPFALLVVPAMLAGLDAWHGLFRFATRYFPRLGDANEWSWLLRFLLRWLTVSLPPAAVLLGLHLAAPGEFGKFASEWDAWRFSLSLCIWYGFLNLPNVTRNDEAISIAMLTRWFKETHRACRTA